jgi:hypothetical protein
VRRLPRRSYRYLTGNNFGRRQSNHVAIKFGCGSAPAGTDMLHGERPGVWPYCSCGSPPETGTLAQRRHRIASGRRSRWQRPLAKLTVPRLQDPVARERLYSWLDKQGSRPLVWTAAHQEPARPLLSPAISSERRKALHGIALTKVTADVIGCWRAICAPWRRPRPRRCIDGCWQNRRSSLRPQAGRQSCGSG